MFKKFYLRVLFALLCFGIIAGNAFALAPDTETKVQKNEPAKQEEMREESENRVVDEEKLKEELMEKTDSDDEMDEETMHHKDGVEYDVIFKSLWSCKTHPNKYPKDASFSTFVGIVHNNKACLWKEGMKASDGMAKLAETGKNGRLEKEISKMKKKGGIREKFFIKGGKNSKKERKTEIEVCEDYPMVSMAAMIGPSPDWFTGLDSVCLIEKGKWVDKKIVMVYAYDAGTKEGKTYMDNGRDTRPQDKIMRLECDPFLYDGELVPVGCIMFVRDDD